MSEAKKEDKCKQYTYKPTAKAFQKQETIESKYSKLLKSTRNLHSVMNETMDFTKEPTENQINDIKTVEELIKE